MSTFKILILVVALVFSLWPSYINAGIAFVKEPLFRKVKYIGTAFLVQFLMAGAGMYIASKIASFEQKVNIFISLSILLLVGLKLILAEIKIPNTVKSPDYTDSKTSYLQAISEGLYALAISISIALLSDQLLLHWAITGVFLLCGISIAFVFATKISDYFLKFRFNAIAGVLMLAVALKLFLTVIGYGF